MTSDYIAGNRANCKSFFHRPTPQTFFFLPPILYEKRKICNINSIKQSSFLHGAFLPNILKTNFVNVKTTQMGIVKSH